MERGGWRWWADLEEAMNEKSSFFTEEIVFFDPPREHHAAYNLASHDTATTGVRPAEMTDGHSATQE
eukprot:CAMPEP_0174704712 /NCGR_PEP_ID=MMETSP1094-20130205/8204_1 /TAXON_ID=156173 /ORGANISM="Chrysochromulina brevifilum, Strain UTEX LB 985" /LENGTH=66 /DNA_ID=CAMNT_0015902797 /DNA_START=56 /DNA_END=256 /DNA_ORIENTATION=-